MKDIGIEKKSLSSIAFKKIIELIENDVIKIGEKLDAEQKLANKLNISRPILREALQKLEYEGYIIRKHGVGTFVISKTPMFSTGIEKLDSITELVGAQNYVVGTIGTTKPSKYTDDTILNMLCMDKTDDLMFFERIRTADKKPFALDFIYIPEKYVCEDFHSKYADASMLKYFSNVQGIPIFSSQCNVFAENASASIADKLGILENEALQVLEQTFYTNKNKPVFYGKSLIVNNIMRFHLVRR